jgi:hypothetical protein
VAAVGLAVEAPGRDAGVEVGGVRGADLQDVGDVQPQQELDPLVVGNPHVAELPQLVPGPRVALEGLVVRRVATDRLAGVDQRLVYGGVARRVEGKHLLHAHGIPLFDLEREHLVDVVLHLVEAAVHGGVGAPAVDAGAGGLGDVDARLAGPHLKGDDLGPEGPGGDGI